VLKDRTGGTSNSSKNSSAPAGWGRDRNGQDVGSYPIQRFEERTAKRLALTVRESESRAFREARDREAQGYRDPVTGDPIIVTDT
jgi:hypothetical protein